jgi:hypothetical protein
MNDFIFVEHSKGEYEGTKYDYVVLNDGLLPFKAQNKTNLSELPFSEGDKVKCSLRVKGTKNLQPKADLLKIDKA